MEQKCKEIQDVPEETLGKVTNNEPYLLLGSLDLFLGLSYTNPDYILQDLGLAIRGVRLVPLDIICVP